MTQMVAQGSYFVTIQPKLKKRADATNSNCSAVLQMREIGLRAIAALCEQVYDKADAVLLDSYVIFLVNLRFYPWRQR